MIHGSQATVALMLRKLTRATRYSTGQRPGPPLPAPAGPRAAAAPAPPCRRRPRPGAARPTTPGRSPAEAAAPASWAGRAPRSGSSPAAARRCPAAGPIAVGARCAGPPLPDAARDKTGTRPCPNTARADPAGRAQTTPAALRPTRHTARQRAAGSWPHLVDGIGVVGVAPGQVGHWRRVERP